MRTHQATEVPRVGTQHRNDAEHQAVLLLRTAFPVAPVVFGLDKFHDVAVRDFGLLLAALALVRLASGQRRTRTPATAGSSR